MMKLIESSGFGMPPEETGADIAITSIESFVRGVYSSVDRAAACGLGRLRSEAGILPACKRGCCHCCRFHIVTNIAEAHTLAQYVKRELSADQISGLQMRTQQWHAWDDSRLGRHPSTDRVERKDLLAYPQWCPLLVNGACSAYPVRPIVCRTHFVCSHPIACCAANDPESAEDAPMVLMSVVAATSSFSLAIREHIESAGLDFSRSQMLLPHWLAHAMHWDFAVG